MKVRHHTFTRRSLRLGIATTAALGVLTLGEAGVGAASFQVTNTQSDGNGSLAAAVTAANAASGSDTITFAADVAGRIDTKDVPAITDDVTIIGSGVAALELTNTSGPGLLVEQDADLAVSNLTIVDPNLGGADADGIDARNGGSIELADLVLFDVRNGVVITDDDNSNSIAFHTLTIDNTVVAGASESAVRADRISLATIKDVSMIEVATGLTADETNAVRLERIEITDATAAGVLLESVRFPTLVDLEIAPSSGSATPNSLGISLGNADIVSVSGTRVAGAGAGGIVTDGVATSMRVTSSSVSNSKFGLGLDDVLGLDVDRTTLSRNGTGIELSGISTGTIERTSVTENGAGTITGEGGIVISSQPGVPQDIEIDNVTIEGNVAQTLAGGLTITDDDNTVTIFESLIDRNRGALAAAIHVADDDATGSVVVDSSTISNHASAPTVNLASGALDVATSTVANNTSSGALLNVDGGTLKLRHSTVADNTAAIAISSAVGAVVDIDHSIVAGNTGTPFAGSGGVTATDSLLADSTPNAIGAGNDLTGAPLLGALEDNGGPTPTLLPAPGSPAVDAGDAAASSAPDFDQRGFVRPDGTGDVIDIGAVEVVARPLVELVTPARLLDTRTNGTTIDGESQGLGRLASGTTTVVDVAGRAGLPRLAKAAVVNITAVGPSGVGFVTAHPCLDDVPLASSLNFRGGVAAGNEVIISLADGDDVCLFNQGETDLVMDIIGFVSFGSRYDAVGPARLLDTRPTGSTIDGQFEGGGPRSAGSGLELAVAGRGGVGIDATAVAINVTAVGPSIAGFVTVHPCLSRVPTAASLNFQVGVNRGNELVAQLDDSGKVCLFVEGATHLVVDVVGEIGHETLYQPVGPARLLETRPGIASGTVDGEENGQGTINSPRDNKVAENTVRVPFAGRVGVPAQVDAVVVNVTAIRPPTRGFFTVWDCGGQRPLAAALNFAAGDIVGNELIVEGGFSGEFCIFSSVDTHVTADIVAFLPQSENDSVLNP